MANPEHLEILKQGVETWNQWRKDNPKVTPDFSEAKLGGTDLSGANLSYALLSEAIFVGANLSNTVSLRQKLVITAAISAAQKFADNEESNVIEIWQRLRTRRRALSGRRVKKEVTKNIAYE